MKKYLLLLALSAPVLGIAAPLNQYTDIDNALLHGKEIVVVTNLNHCTPQLPISASYKPKAVMLLKDRISFSSSHLTVNNPKHKGEAVIENTTYNITKDNKLTLTTVVLNAQSYQPYSQSKPFSVTCHLGKEGGASIYQL